MKIQLVKRWDSHGKQWFPFTVAISLSPQSRIPVSAQEGTRLTAWRELGLALEVVTWTLCVPWNRNPSTCITSHSLFRVTTPHPSPEARPSTQKHTHTPHIPILSIHVRAHTHVHMCTHMYTELENRFKRELWGLRRNLLTLERKKTTSCVDLLLGSCYEDEKRRKRQLYT